MDDAQADHRPADRPTDADSGTSTDRDDAWERAFDGPPINPRSALIYHDGKPLRSRHS